MQKNIIPFLLITSFLSCQKREEEVLLKGRDTITKVSIDTTAADTINYSLPERPNFILADIDGENKQDSVIIIKDRFSDKEGLRIVFSSAKVDTLGIVREVAGEGFDDISWAGIFEKAPKGEPYASNVDQEGEFRDMDKVPDSEWVTLKADGIFTHAAESCGGGIIYLEDGAYKWIQQE